MAKIRILSVRKVVVDNSGFTNVKVPNTSFFVVINVDKAQELLLDHTNSRKALEASAHAVYKKFLVQTVKQLQKFDKLFAGMLAKGAAPEVVEKQANALKEALEKEARKWEKSAARTVREDLRKLAKRKR